MNSAFQLNTRGCACFWGWCGWGGFAGVHADDSILVQFILDLQTNTVNNSIGSNNTEIVIENWQDEDEGELPNHREEDIFAQDDSSEGERDEVETTLVSYLGREAEL